MNCSPLDCQKQALEARIKELEAALDTDVKLLACSNCESLENDRGRLASLIEAKDREISRLEQRLLTDADRVTALSQELNDDAAHMMKVHEALELLRDDIINNANDTVWVGAGETACERITSILGDDWGADGKCEARQAPQDLEDWNRQPLAQVERRSSEAAGGYISVDPKEAIKSNWEMIKKLRLPGQNKPNGGSN